MTDWDKELAKIDKQLASISDEELKRGTAPAPAARPPAGGKPPAKTAAPVAPSPERAAGGGARATTTFGVVLRLLLGIAIGAGVAYYWFWRMPVGERCGLPLAGYLSASAVGALVGVWSAVWSWRHRAPRAHVLSLLVVTWCAALVGVEVLPRVGYAKADASRSGWLCHAAPAPAGATVPQTTTPQPAAPQPASPQPASPQPAAPTAGTTTPTPAATPR